MGDILSWVAVRGQSRSSVLDELDLTDIEGVDQGGVDAVSLADWHIVFDPEVNPPGYLRYPDVLQRLSRGAEVVACYESSFGPSSVAAGLRDGRQSWVVGHDRDVSADHLEYEGDLPGEFADVLARARARQAASREVDFLYEVPLELAWLVTGYRADNVLRGERPAGYSSSVRAFTATRVHYSYRVVGLTDRAQAIKVLGAVGDVHDREYLGEDVFNSRGEEPDGQWTAYGDTEDTPVLVAGFDRWRPRFEEAVTRAAAQVAPQARVEIEWSFPDDPARKVP
ncbi:hypothetical protein [Nocardia sp. R6R-6]|uniref:hypothetical protein n=1 Tax=Nocardia sp. R6R-6 TaxID=3459303 RepID=UPI00403DA0C1